MLLAEALAARKDAAAQIDGLRDRLAAAVVRYEDQAASPEDHSEVLSELGRTLDRYESLTVRVNRTNNQATVRFDGRDITIMEAIALRDRLVHEAKARRASVDALEHANGAGKAGRGWLGTRRAKDDIREIPTVDLRAERQAADAVSEAVRRLDLVIQQRNWTTELVE